MLNWGAPELLVEFLSLTVTEPGNIDLRFCLESLITAWIWSLTFFSLSFVPFCYYKLVYFEEVLLSDLVSWPTPLLLNWAVVPEMRLSCLFAKVFSNDITWFNWFLEPGVLLSGAAEGTFSADGIVLIITGCGYVVDVDLGGVTLPVF